MHNVTWVTMPEKRRTREEFEAYLKAMLDQDYPKVKYQSPDAWQARANKKSGTS
jgi:IS5 family transposase